MRKVNYIDVVTGEVTPLAVNSTSSRFRSISDLKGYSDNEIVQGESMVDDTYYKPLQEQIERIMRFNWPKRGERDNFIEGDETDIDDIELPEDLLDAMDVSQDFLELQQQKANQATNPPVNGSMTPQEPEKAPAGDE